MTFLDGQKSLSADLEIEEDFALISASLCAVMKTAPEPTRVRGLFPANAALKQQ